jgi:hypothetical protein
MAKDKPPPVWTNLFDPEDYPPDEEPKPGPEPEPVAKPEPQVKKKRHRKFLPHLWRR